MNRHEACFPVSGPLGSENWETPPNPFRSKELLFSGVGDANSSEKQKNAEKSPGGEEQGQQDTEKRAIPNREGRAAISRALKSWLDNVIVPTLVRRYLVEREQASRRRGTCGGTDTDLCST